MTAPECSLASRASGTAQLVATDASVAADRIGLAWLGNDGTWWIAGAPDGYPGPDSRERSNFVAAAELRAIAAAVRHHPRRILVLTDSLVAARTTGSWLRQDRKLRADIAECADIADLREAMLQRRSTPNPVSVRWAGKNIYRLNNGADRLTRLAARYGTSPHGPAAWAEEAEAIAREAASLHETQMRAAPPTRLEGTAR